MRLMLKASAPQNSYYLLSGIFYSLHLSREFGRSMDPRNSIMFLLGLVLVCGVAAEEVTIVDNWNVEISDDTLIRVSATKQVSDHLDLSAFPVRYLWPKCFEDVRGLKRLTLRITEDTHPFIEHLPPMVFWYLPDLEYLSLANSNIWKIAYTFWGLSKLRVLDLRNSTVVPDQGIFCGMNKTTKILLDGSNMHSVLPEHYLEPYPLLALCMSEGIVRSLDLFQNTISTKQTCEVDFLHTDEDSLFLNGNDITGFDEGWYRIVGATSVLLSLGCNRITEVSSNLVNGLPKDVYYLNLAGNNIWTVEDGKINNPYLRHLDLSHNPIVKIDPYAFAMTKLTHIRLSLNFMEHLPKTLESLKIIVDNEERNYKLELTGV